MSYKWMSYVTQWMHLSHIWIRRIGIARPALQPPISSHTWAPEQPYVTYTYKHIIIYIYIYIYICIYIYIYICISCDTEVSLAPHSSLPSTLTPGRPESLYFICTYTYIYMCIYIHYVTSRYRLPRTRVSHLLSPLGDPNNYMSLVPP